MIADKLLIGGASEKKKLPLRMFLAVVRQCEDIGIEKIFLSDKRPPPPTAT